ncbi:MAG: hypothetical protein HYY38_00335 [Rhodospirillales bacterium]|nr:hypothetical protein [Rhodospirillales bacterium]
MTSTLRYLGQGTVYALFAALIGYLSMYPVYNPFPSDHALVKFSLAYAGKPKGECHRRTAEELAKLAPNMRKPFVCPRQRLSLLIELEMDGAVLYRDVLNPTGLSGDGPSRAYRRFTVPAGEHRFVARLRDSDRAEGFDHVRDEKVTLKVGQNLAIDFKGTAAGFTLN